MLTAWQGISFTAKGLCRGAVHPEGGPTWGLRTGRAPGREDIHRLSKSLAIGKGPAAGVAPGDGPLWIPGDPSISDEEVLEFPGSGDGPWAQYLHDPDTGDEESRVES